MSHFERATKVTMDAVERLKENGVKVNETTENEFRDKYEAETEIIHDVKTKVSEIAANVEKPIEELRSIEEEQTLISNTDNPTSSLTQETEQPSPQTSGGNVVAPYEAKINKKLRSSRDLARKMLSFLDKIKEGEVKAENFPADLVENLGVSKQVEGSEYVHFVSQDGEKITLRLSDHHGNARNIIIKGVRTDKGVSIVISLPGVDLGKYKANKWAKVDEYVYESPSVEQLYNIGKSIFNLFNSGEYIDLADAKKHLRSPRVTELKANGVVYGWAMNGEIYLTPDGINPNTPVHEYAHLWGADVEKNNPKLWNEVVEAMKLSPVWNEVANDANYSNIHGNDSRMASEVLARLSGRENYRRTMEEAEKEIAAERDIVGKVQKKGILNRIKNALKNFWDWVQRNVFKSGKQDPGPRSAEVMPWEEFANSVIGDFYKGKNPNVKESSLEKMAAGENSAEMQEGETRFRKVEETVEGSIDDIQAQPMTLMERITNSLLEVSAKNKENLGLRADALKAFGKDITRVLSIMKVQKEYDKSTVDTLVKLAKMYFKNAQLLGEVDTYTMGRVLSLINNVVGKEDVTASAAKLMDILLDAHTKALAGILDKAEKVKAKKVNAAGVEVMGNLVHRQVRL